MCVFVDVVVLGSPDVTVPRSMGQSYRLGKSTNGKIQNGGYDHGVVFSHAELVQPQPEPLMCYNAKWLVNIVNHCILYFSENLFTGSFCYNIFSRIQSSGAAYQTALTCSLDNSVSSVVVDTHYAT